MNTELNTWPEERTTPLLLLEHLILQYLDTEGSPDKREIQFFLVCFNAATKLAIDNLDFDWQKCTEIEAYEHLLVNIPTYHKLIDVLYVKVNEVIEAARKERGGRAMWKDKREWEYKLNKETEMRNKREFQDKLRKMNNKLEQIEKENNE